MPISWEQFEQMIEAINDAQQQMLELLDVRDAQDEEEYKRLRQFIIDEGGKVESSRGEYSPPLDAPGAREQWQDLKAEVKEMRRWALTESLTEWNASRTED